MKKFNLELSSPLPLGEHKAKALGNNLYVTMENGSVKKICTRYISDKVVEGCLVVTANGMKACFMLAKKVESKIFEATLPEVIVEASRIEVPKAEEVKIEEVKEEPKEEPKEIEPVVDFVAEEPKAKKAKRKPRRKTIKKAPKKEEE